MTFQDTTYYASYEFFEVLDVSTHYQLLVGGYTGTAGDGLWYHNKMPFSTEDHDIDHCDCNCAEAYTGAWWYKKCHRSNLNGNWSSPVRGQGVHWFLLTSNNDTLSYVDMKTRRWKQSSTTLI
ncbi:tenascin-R [Aplysia californica]|uniref:Tenascin-R n=1 Tax=Aplysia californica TaxID=6500 RepID=A0ABM0JIM0_APLCA|nr:tenascin-R [Aplysia californica]